MSRIFGYVIGVIWFLLAMAAYGNSISGWGGGHSDLGFWWGVVGTFLLIGAVAAALGTARHRYQGPRK